MLNNWHRVSAHEPCPVCEHADWCLIANDGSACICQRVESDHPTRNSGGWIHRLAAPASPRPANATTAVRRIAPSTGPRQAATPTIAAYFAALPTAWHNCQERMCTRLENDLGLPKDILLALDWRWDAAAHAVAIPMRDAWGEVTGIRYRSIEDGSKWAKRGSKDGLFFDPEFIPYDPEELVICEGPTDCAAAMACGFWSVGRSSCATGAEALKELIRRKHVRRVTIVADDDKPKPKPGGGTWRPGLDGARRLSEKLGVAYRIVLPPAGFKDLRDWYRAGTLNETSFKGMCQGSDWSCAKAAGGSYGKAGSRSDVFGGPADMACVR